VCLSDCFKISYLLAPHPLKEEKEDRKVIILSVLDYLMEYMVSFCSFGSGSLGGDHKIPSK
jgi:hypothetical protein